MLEPHRERARVELRARRLVARERAREHDRALVAVDAHDQLQTDLLELDVALLGEREVEPELGAAVDDRELLREPVVQERRRLALGEERVAELVEALVAD